MNVHVIMREPPSRQPLASMQGAGTFSGFIGGSIGYVREQFIKNAAVKVELLNGIILHQVRVASREWVAVIDDEATGTVDLPPLGSMVFVLFPYGMENLSGAMVLCSVYDDRNDTHAKRLVEGEGKKVVTLREGGIKTIYDRATGNYLLEDVDDPSFLVRVDKGSSEIELVDWNANRFMLSSDGVTISAKGNTVELLSGKTVINGNLEVAQ